MIVLIDNYDSFTYNIVQVLGDCGATDVKVYRNNKIDASEVFSLNPRAIILSPGPGNPDQSGVCIDILNAYRDQNAKAISIPLLGVCLGHQAIGQVFGRHRVQGSCARPWKNIHIDPHGSRIVPITAAKFGGCALPLACH